MFSFFFYQDKKKQTNICFHSPQIVQRMNITKSNLDNHMFHSNSNDWICMCEQELLLVP